MIHKPVRKRLAHSVLLLLVMGVSGCQFVLDACRSEYPLRSRAEACERGALEIAPRIHEVSLSEDSSSLSCSSECSNRYHAASMRDLSEACEKACSIALGHLRDSARINRDAEGGADFRLPGGSIKTF